MMEAALLSRLRSNSDVIAVAGTFNGEPAIDFDERKSNDRSSFPAAIQTVVAGVKNYSQDGPVGARTWRMRWECFGFTPDQAYDLAQAIIGVLELSSELDGVRFGRGFVSLERSFPPETVGDLAIFRRILDMDITATF